MRDLLTATLRDVAWHVDPITGIAHDRLPWEAGGDEYTAIAGVFPQASQGLDSGASNRLDVAVVRDSSFSFDAALSVSYNPSIGQGSCTGAGGAGFGYQPILFAHELASPAVRHMNVRARGSRDDAVLEVKLEATGCQLICGGVYKTDFETRSFDVPGDCTCVGTCPCDLSQTNALTLAATDTGVVGCPATWTVDYISLDVDPSEIGDLANLWGSRCTGTHQPLPCGSTATGVDKIGYAMAALAAGACAGVDVDVPGFVNVEDALLAGLTSLEQWRKWNSEAPGQPWLGTDGFPWTWVDPSTGLPMTEDVFGIDSANFDASLAVVEQVSSASCPGLVRSGSATWTEVASKAHGIRQGIDWSNLNNASSEPVLAWKASGTAPDFDPATGLSVYRQGARSDESILRTFLAIARGGLTPEYWNSLRCDTRTIDGLTWLTWDKTDADPVQCDATFLQQASLLFLDVDALPVPDDAGISHRESLVSLMQAHGIGEYVLAGYSDCQAPDGSDYYTGCGIPDDVVTPQASILGLEFMPEACNTIQRFLDEGVASPVDVGGEMVPRGFRDSVWVANGGIDPERPYGDQVFLSLDKSREALALINYLHGGLVRELFERNLEIGPAYDGLVGQTACATPWPMD